MELRKDFCLTSVSGRIPRARDLDQEDTNVLGPLAFLTGTWTGTGFNQIWRPFKGSGTQDRFLELNETIETLEFDAIPGDIPNRGLLQGDINLAGIRYLQQIQDANVPGPNGKPAGIHVEPGIWLSVPNTGDPQDGATVARMANIPHGTSIVAQGSILGTIPGAPEFKPTSITPFTIATPVKLITFPESDLSTPSQFRTPAADIPHVTQAMVDNPNLVLAAGIAGKTIISTTTLRISTLPLDPPGSGGGTANIAFLQGAGDGPNAQSAQVDAVFWIETIQYPDGSTRLQLQYSQTVLLNFKGLSWPHVSVATLLKQHH